MDALSARKLDAEVDFNPKKLILELFVQFFGYISVPCLIAGHSRAAAVNRGFATKPLGYVIFEATTLLYLYFYGAVLVYWRATGVQVDVRAIELTVRTTGSLYPCCTLTGIQQLYLHSAKRQQWRLNTHTCRCMSCGLLTIFLKP